jgi:myo-inositol catabolism protein IolS
LLFATLAKIQAISDRLSIPMADLAVAWPLHTKGISSVITGATKMSQVEANVRAGGIVLPSAIVTELAEATEELKQAMGKNADLWQGANSRIG